MSTLHFTEDHLFYRQIKPNANPLFYDPLKRPPVFFTLFLPTRQDIDGLSLIDATRRTPIWAAYRLQLPGVRFRLAEITYGAFQEKASEFNIGLLSFVESPDLIDNEKGVPWAHCTIKNIDITTYDSDPSFKKKVKEWARAVAFEITQAQIKGPFESPTCFDQYRPQ